MLVKPRMKLEGLTKIRCVKISVISKEEEIAGLLFITVKHSLFRRKKNEAQIDEVKEER